MGKLQLKFSHRLLCGDSTNKHDFEKLFGDSRAEFCFTSPPYSDQRDYEGNLNLDCKHLAKIFNAPCELFAVNLGIQRKDNEVLPYWDDYIQVAKESGYKFLSWNVWNKMECGSIGNQTAMFGISHEWIFVFGKSRKKLNRTNPNKSAGSNANHTGNRGKDGIVRKGMDCIVSEFRQLDTVLNLSPLKARDDIDHPARFPIELPEEYIKACSDDGNIIFEPFCGSGTTLIACEKTKRCCYAIEISPYYCDIILKRYEDFSGKKVVKLCSQS